MLTGKDMFFNRREAQQLVSAFISLSPHPNSDLDNNLIKLPLPAILKPHALWSGKQIFSMVLNPNQIAENQALINVESKNKQYTKDGTMCSKDGCN